MIMYLNTLSDFNFPGGSIGLRPIDVRRGDLWGSHLGYVTVSSSYTAAPPDPEWVSLTAQYGIVNAEVICSVPVDLFRVSWSTDDIPDPNNVEDSVNGIFNFPISDADDYNFWCCVEKDGSYSSWVPWLGAGTGETGDGDWVKNFDRTLSIPYAVHTWAVNVWHANDIVEGGTYCTGGRLHSGLDTRNMLAVYDYSDGIKLSKYGGKYEMTQRYEKAGGHIGGVVFGATDTLRTSWNTTNFYVLALYGFGANDTRGILYKYINGARSTIAESGNILALLKAGGCTPLRFEWVDNIFTITRMDTDTILWAYQDTYIDHAIDRITPGIYMNTDISQYSYFQPTNFIRIYGRVTAPDNVPVTIGQPTDLLQTYAETAVTITDADDKTYGPLTHTPIDVENPRFEIGGKFCKCGAVGSDADVTLNMSTLEYTLQNDVPLEVGMKIFAVYEYGE